MCYCNIEEARSFSHKKARQVVKTNSFFQHGRGHVRRRGGHDQILQPHRIRAGRCQSAALHREFINLFSILGNCIDSFRAKLIICGWQDKLKIERLRLMPRFILLGYYIYGAALERWITWTNCTALLESRCWSYVVTSLVLVFTDSNLWKFTKILNFKLFANFCKVYCFYGLRFNTIKCRTQKAGKLKVSHELYRYMITILHRLSIYTSMNHSLFQTSNKVLVL